jgi:hypothetical protein
MNNLKKYIQVSEDFGNLILTDGEMICFIVKHEPTIEVLCEEHSKFYINFLHQMPQEILYISCKNIVLKYLDKITLLNAKDSK